jgi:hypothetical protein
MATAYCVQMPRGKGRDLSSANRYGTVETILSEIDNPSLNPAACLHKLSKALRDFGPHDVLFSAGGDHLSLALALCVLKDQGFSEINYLRWERERDIDGQRKAGVGYYVKAPLPLKL